MSGIISDNVGRSSGLLKAPSGGKTVKRHYFEFNTRTQGAGSGVQFVFTTAFTPTDPTVNDLRIQSVTPMKSTSGDWGWYGLRFIKSGGSTYDYHGKGLWYVDPNSYQSMVGFDFTLAAGTLPAGTYTVSLFAGDATAASASSYFCCSTSDHAQVGVQTVSTLTITEFKN